MDNQNISNAIIESAQVRIDRDFILTVWLYLKYGDGGSGQGFGGFVLGGEPGTAAGKHDQQPNIAGEFIMGCLRAADVDSWDKLAGKAIRVRLTSGNRWDSTIEAIGHIIKDDRWFNPSERFAVLLGKRKDVPA